MLKRYNVYGEYKGIRINLVEEAYSPKQAKFKSAFAMGFKGRDIGSFMKSKNVRVKGI